MRSATVKFTAPYMCGKSLVVDGDAVGVDAQVPRLDQGLTFQPVDRGVGGAAHVHHEHGRDVAFLVAVACEQALVGLQTAVPVCIGLHDGVQIDRILEGLVSGALVLRR